MKSLFYYLAQVVVVSGILYAYYHIALRNKKFHQYNRFYILAATLASILIPFLNIPVYFTGEDKWMYALQNLSGPTVVVDVNTVVKEENPFNWQRLLYTLYALMAVAGGIKICLSVYRLKKIMRKHPVEHLNGIRFINTEEPGTPFSFFRWLFWNNRIELSSQKGEQIFRHEVFHIEQKHSIDAVFMETITIVFWINPFFHLMKKELKAIHEFLADRFASHDTEKWEYAEMLLMQALNTQHSLVHPFFHNQIKRRIAMITNPQKTSHQYLRKLLVLPLTALLVTLFAFSYQEKQSEPLPEIAEVTIMPEPIKSSDGSATIITASQVKTTLKKDDKKFPGLFIFNGKKFTREQFQEFTGEKRNDVAIEAKTVISFTANDKNAIAKYGERARPGVIEFIEARIDTTPKRSLQSITLKGTVNTGTEPLIILDGVPQEKSDSKQKLSDLNPETIETISVLKDASATSLYGEKGKDGVLIITTKKGFSGKLAEPHEEVKVVGVGHAAKPGKQLVELKLSQPALEEVVVTGYGVKKTESKNLEGKVTEVPVKDAGLQSVTISATPRIIENVSVARASSRIEVDPAFPGGASAWYNFLNKNLDAAAPAKHNAPEGTYVVQIRMKVHEDGRLSDFKALTNHGYGMEEAAVRALQNSPYWNPAYQNGKAVNTIKIQAFTFAIKSDKPKLESVTLENAPAVTVYPNPANKTVSVRFFSPEDREVQVRIVDMSGKEKFRTKINQSKGTSTNTFPIGDLAPGNYVLNIAGKGMPPTSHSFVKE